MLEVRDLRTWFFREDGLSRAVDGVSFSIFEGETVGLVGESGCGKSVTALSLLGLQPNPPGRIMQGSSIRWMGEELVGADRGRLREVRGREVAMIFQDPSVSLDPVRSVRSQVAEALVVHGRAPKKEALERADQLLAEVGFRDVARVGRAYPHQLSGGMCQRVMIAMALSCEPTMLVADEPTTALDATTQAEILELLARLRERRGTSMLLITHDLGVIAEMCDRVLVMYAGRIVEAGLVEELLGDPRHPYTRGLLRSLPDAGGVRGRLQPIEGRVPPSTAWPAGCRFRDRCPRAMPRCRTEPELTAPSEGRLVRCWLADEDAKEGWK